MQSHELTCTSLSLHSSVPWTQVQWAYMKFHELACIFMSLHAVPFFVWAAHKNFAVLVIEQIHSLLWAVITTAVNAITGWICRGWNERLVDNQVETRQQCRVIRCHNNMDTIQPGTMENIQSDSKGNNINAIIGVEVNYFTELFKNSVAKVLK